MYNCLFFSCVTIAMSWPLNAGSDDASVMFCEPCKNVKTLAFCLDSSLLFFIIYIIIMFVYSSIVLPWQCHGR